MKNVPGVGTIVPCALIESSSLNQHEPQYHPLCYDQFI